MNKVDYLEKELARLIDWIKSADTRISFILPLSTVMLGTMAALAPTLNEWTKISAFAVFAASLLLVFSIVFIALATFPRTKGPKKSMIFFGCINTMDLEQFRTSVSSLEEGEYINDLIDQCHINAQIAEEKFVWIKKSLASLFLSSLPWFVSIYLLYEMK